LRVRAHESVIHAIVHDAFSDEAKKIKNDDRRVEELRPLSSMGSAVAEKNSNEDHHQQKQGALSDFPGSVNLSDIHQ
jgi:hypothetical protein